VGFIIECGQLNARERINVWSSRHHRKGLAAPEAAQVAAIADVLKRCVWMPGRLNWWIGVVFAVGALLFALASALSLAPALAASWAISPAAINGIYFAGSVPFTTAAYLQLFQAANAGPQSETLKAAPRRRVFGWKPSDTGWLSCALQFVGTVLFNINTLDAMIPSMTWFEQDLVVWIPDMLGSILFLLSGYLAFVEVCYCSWAWRPRSLSWWIVIINLLGCLGFLVSAILSLVLPIGEREWVATIAVRFTLFGAICFLAGSLLLLPETAIEPAS
jgi:hypothetical protein